MFNNVIERDNNFIIYNSYTGAIVILDAIAKYNYLQLKSNSEYKFSELPRFLEQGIIVPFEQNEVNKVIFYEKQRLYSNNKLFSLTIAPTLKCNYNCFYCFEHGSNCNDENLPIDYIIEFIKKKYYETKFEKLYIKWFGGEPLLKKDTILSLGEKVKEFCNNHHIYFYSSIITNGLFMTKSTVEELKYTCNLRGAQITLDGDWNEYCKAKQTNKQNYDNVINNIINASLILEVHVRFNVTKANIDSIDKVISKLKLLCKERGNEDNIKFDIARVRDYSSLTGEQNIKQDLIFNGFDTSCDFGEKYQTLKDTYYSNKRIKVRRTYCMERTASFYTIGPNGDLFKCPHFLGRHDKKIGNVVYGESYNTFSDEYINMPYPQKCLKCSMFAVCLAGCPQQRITNINGDCSDCRDEILNDVWSFCRSHLDFNHKESSRKED